MFAWFCPTGCKCPWTVGQHICLGGPSGSHSEKTLTEHLYEIKLIYNIFVIKIMVSTLKEIHKMNSIQLCKNIMLMSPFDQEISWFNVWHLYWTLRSINCCERRSFCYRLESMYVYDAADSQFSSSMWFRLISISKFVLFLFSLHVNCRGWNVTHYLHCEA